VLDVSALGASTPASADRRVTSLRNQERRAIEEALRQTRGRVSGPRGAAALLELPSTTLESKIERLRIDKHRFRSGRDSRGPRP
jgi:transcriptional regulator with GAF, ATPase, and Fis domain